MTRSTLNGNGSASFRNSSSRYSLNRPICKRMKDSWQGFSSTSLVGRPLLAPEKLTTSLSKQKCGSWVTWGEEDVQLAAFDDTTGLQEHQQALRIGQDTPGKYLVDWPVNWAHMLQGFAKWHGRGSLKLLQDLAKKHQTYLAPPEPVLQARPSATQPWMSPRAKADMQYSHDIFQQIV